MQVAHTRYGQLICSPNDVYIGRGLIEYGEFSEAEVDFFRQVITKDTIVCDVGANIGAHTLAFARLAKQVYAFEPHPQFYAALCGMIALNELRNVVPINAGCYSRDATLTYEPVNTDQPDNHGAHQLHPFAADKPQTRVIRLATDCQFLKIDVEGMELDVLRGANDMIRRCRPLMYIEADQEQKFRPLLDYLHSLDYHAYWHKPLLFNPNNFKGRPDNIWRDNDLGSMNLICSPISIQTIGPEATEFPVGFVRQDLAEVARDVGS